MSDISPAIPAAPPPTLRRLLFGDDGLRAGWSLLLFILILVGLGFGLNAVIHHFHLIPKGYLAGKDMTPNTTLVGDGIQFFVVLVAAFLMSLLERRPFARYGLTTRRMLPDLLSGLAWGLVMLSLLVGVLYLTHAISFDGIALHGTAAVSSALRWALAFLCVGLTEEFVTRGYLQYTVSRGVAGITRTFDPRNRFSHVIGFWVAAFLFSVCLFMVGHIGNPGETLPGILAVGVAGATFAFSLWRTGSLWWAIGIHTSWDWAQSCLYGTRDSGIVATGHILSSHPTGPAWLSGGPTGPEGSIFVIPTLLLVALIIHLTLPRRPYFLTPDQSPPQESIPHVSPGAPGPDLTPIV